MKVLIHYTTQNVVFDLFSKKGTYNFKVPERIKNVSDFYKKYNRTQNHLFFVVSYFDVHASETKYSVCNISYDETTSNYKYSSVSQYTINSICDELGLNSNNTYDKESFYRVLTIEGHEKDFINNKKESALNKIRMKFFTWEELFDENELLFNEINNKIFNTDNVLKVASTYTPQIKYSDKQKKQKYFDALKSIGFISNTGVNISHKTLHGDIGEFLMHIMLSKFLSDKSIKKYIYPKLVFKTSPNMAVYGNDGTIYIEDTKEIFYLEAKFYSNLDTAVNKAVESLKSHNEVCEETITHRIEMFRNIETDELNEIVEIDENITENLVLFLICDDYSNYEDILNIVKKNKKLTKLKKDYNIVLFVLPIINKQEYLNSFYAKSNNIWKELNA
ncbi:hypothetical protein A7H1H_0871 [Aliarcobacter butzleri 7h1h]|uniref:Hachiman antiphage defense system protein HamA n=1 Tax=Aliarcobacter butzleri TaxID=28197 RepID=UPI00035B9F44|nr:Hachiman antiphage defense system protein HamA [Aliarcobacter butzleri]AGR77175.1 hypothetical protein A7H1H_0871 [Aliarcobacter butzleri 7h1h]